MTTVVIDLKNKAMYADRLCTMTVRENRAGLVKTCFFGETWGEPYKYQKDITKCHKIERLNIIFCGAGSSNLITECYNAVFNEDPLPKIGKEALGTTIYVMQGTSSSAKLYKYEAVKYTKWLGMVEEYKWELSVYACEEGYITDDSGGDYAKGALATGCSPKFAIQAASKCCPYTNDEVDEVRL